MEKIVVKNMHFLRIKKFQAAITHLWINLFIIVVGLLLLFFSNPNRLAHDQIDHKLFLMTYDNPLLFNDDYLMGSPKKALVDNYFSFKFIGKISDIVGGDEIARWVLLPIIFIIFTIGFYYLNFYLTANHLISLMVAMISNWHVPHVLTAEWGLPGPSELDPWTFFQSASPWLVLIFFYGVRKQKEWLIITSLILAGILANLHIISAFYFVGIIILCNFALNNFSKKSLFKAIFYGSISFIFSLPYILRRYSLRLTHLTKFDHLNQEYYDAMQLNAAHTTILGRLENFKIWFIDQWYAIWPLIIAMLAVLLWKKKSLSLRSTDFKRFSLWFIAATVVFNLTFSLIQLIRLYWLHQLPFWNEPRGFQLVYLVLFPHLAILLTLAWKPLAGRLTFQNKLTLLGAVTVLVVAVSWRLLPTFQTTYQRHITPRYSYHTCDAGIYRAFSNPGLPSGVVLKDPDAWSAFRICTRRSVVVQNRDRAFAYSLGSDMMLAWYRRYQEVSQAFERGGPGLIWVAEKYGARVIVSRDCAAVPLQQVERRQEVPGEGCIDVLPRAVAPTAG